MSVKNVLLDKIKEIGSHPFLFVGAGLTKRYLNTENWEELLRKFSTEISGNQFQYDYYSNKVSETDYYGKQPKIASLLEKDYNEAILIKPEHEEFRNRNREMIQKGVSPFKIAISEYLKSVSIDFNNKEIDMLKKIAVRNISGVITTNYDLFLESIFDGYKVYIGQEELIFSDIFEIGEIYKIHGSITDPSSIIITSEDYKNFEDQYAYLIAKILTIFLEYPIIFLGYSIQDRNIQNILKSIAGCLKQDKLAILKDRFIFIEYSESLESLSTYSKTFENGKIIEMTKVTTNDFMGIYSAINEVKAKYNPKVIRKLRKDIYEMTQVNIPTSAIVATGFENIDKIDENTNFILGVGVSNVAGHYIKAEQIYEDVILDNHYFNTNLVVEEYLPELLKSNAGGLPMHKYVLAYQGEVYGKVKENMLKFNSIDSFLNDNLRTNKRWYRKDLSQFTVQEIITKEGIENAYKRLYFLEKDEINISDLEHYLYNAVRNKKVEIKSNSELKRLIRIFDWIKYKKSPDKSSNSANT